MSLVGTLGRIAVGVMVAKGASKMMGGGNRGGGGIGGALGNALGGGRSSGGGGLGGLLGSLTGGGSSSSGGGLGGLGSLLGGGAAAGGAAGGLTGGLGGLLEKVSGGGVPAGNTPPQAPASGSLGHLLNDSLQGQDIPQPNAAQEEQAQMLIKAMVNAAKCDGDIDRQEQEKIVGHLGDDISDEERQFVLDEMKAPLDVQGFINSVPQGAGPQVYMMSLLAIDLDTREEAQYLDTLRKGVGMSEQDADAIHQQVGVPTLYS